MFPSPWDRSHQSPRPAPHTSQTHPSLVLERCGVGGAAGHIHAYAGSPALWRPQGDSGDPERMGLPFPV